MTYEEFLSGLEKAIFVQRREEETIKRVQVLKNNGVQLDGFSCVMEGHREQPTVYVNHYFREDVTKEDLCTLAAMVLKIQRDSMLHQTGDFEMLLDYEKMKKRIYCRLISRNKNEDLLKTVPWIPWMDLAIVFYIEIPGKLIKNATALLRTACTNGVMIWALSRQPARRNCSTGEDAGYPRQDGKTPWSFTVA